MVGGGGGGSIPMKTLPRTGIHVAPTDRAPVDKD